jgi:hypothetical protein
LREELQVPLQPAFRGPGTILSTLNMFVQLDGVPKMSEIS